MNKNKYLLWIFVFTGWISLPLQAGVDATSYTLPQFLLHIVTNTDITFEEEAFADDRFDLFAEEFMDQGPLVWDPLEPINRVMYHVNDQLYYLVLKPVGQAYKHVTPEPIRSSVRHFFFNLSTPIRWINCLLQGKNYAAQVEFQRFIINSTVGVLGINDPARSEFGLEPYEEDLGQTLAVWGFEDGFYIVWPFLGPSTVRDFVGKIGDSFASPTSYVSPWELAVGLRIWKFTNNYSFRIEEYEIFKAETFEPYIAMRDAYIQFRRQEIDK